MLSMRITEGPNDLTPVVDSCRLSGPSTWNVNSHEPPAGEQKSVLTGASGDTDNLTGVVNALGVRAGSPRRINGDKTAPGEKKAVKCGSVIGERTDNVAVIADAKRRSHASAWNGDAGEPSLRQ